MEEKTTMDDFAQELEASFRQIHVGDILEGTVIGISESEITLDLTVDALKDYFVKTIVSKNKMDQVVQIVCEHYNLTQEELLSKKRSNEIAIPRQIAMYICRVYLDENLTKIGIQFGGKNHTTVMHAVDKIKKEITKDDVLNSEIQKMINEIR